MITSNRSKKASVKSGCYSLHYTTLSLKQQAHLATLIADSYGSPSELANYLDLGIEMLFYLEDDTFDKRDVQNVVSAIKGVITALRQ